MSFITMTSLHMTSFIKIRYGKVSVHSNDVLVKKNQCMSAIKFPIKRMFPSFHIVKINSMISFCNLFMERPSYFKNRVFP